MSTNHYMIITTKTDYALDIKNEFKFLGFPERNRSSVRKFNKGDKVVMYVTKASSFAAIVEITGECFYDRKQVWDNEYVIYPYRIPCKVIKYIEKPHDMVFIKDIWDNLEFIRNKGKWGSQVQGSFRTISEHDYNVIELSIKERCNILK